MLDGVLHPEADLSMLLDGAFRETLLTGLGVQT